jgi:hypothetical protein
MPHLEPTYLRYIYDGLIKGSIHPENAAELPDGLIGMYEEVFDERTSVVERQKLLQRFAIWALLKKEVSAAFVAEILGETEDDIQEFISTYSACFNSPESGKYQLYHERLKVYLLQKLSEGEVQTLHEKLIARLEQAIEEQKADEFEWYGLEFLAGHLVVNSNIIQGSIIFENKILVLVNNEEFRERQYFLSTSFDWTYTLIDLTKEYFFSKQKLETAFSIEKVFAKTYFQEKNSFLDLLKFIDQDQIKIYENRFRSFSGNTIQDIEWFFYLSFLCLNKILYKDFNNSNSKIVFIKTTLKIMDDIFPFDTEIFDWQKILSPKHIIPLIEKLKEYELDIKLINRTKLDVVKWQYEFNRDLNIEPEKVSEEKIIIPLNHPDFIKIKNLKKRILKQSDFLEELVNNQEFERSDDLFENLKDEIQKIKKPFFNYRIGKRKGKGGGFGFFEIENASSFYYQVLWKLKFERLNLEDFLEKLLFFDNLKGKRYKNYSLTVFQRYILQKHLLNPENLELLNLKSKVKQYIFSIIQDVNKFSQIESSHYAIIISALAKINETNLAFQFFTKICYNFEYDTSDSYFYEKNSWKQSEFSIIANAFLDAGELNYCLEMLNYISHPLFKDRIKKTISSWYLTQGNHKKVVQFGLSISENKNYFFEFLSEQLHIEEVIKLLKDWMKFDYQEVHTLGICDLVSPKTKNNEAPYLKEIQQDSQNIWSDVYLIMNLSQKNIINEETFINEIDIIFKKIPILKMRIYHMLHFLDISVALKKNSFTGYILSNILEQKKSELNSDWENKIYNLFLIKRINQQVFFNLDLHQPFNYKSKFQTLKVIFTLNFYRPINSLNKPIGYFIDSSFKSLYRFISYVILGLMIFLMPGVVSKLKLKFQLRKIFKSINKGNNQKAVEEFCKLTERQPLNDQIGLEFFRTVYENMVKKNKIVDISNILGYVHLFWDITQKSELLQNYLLLPGLVQRDETYLLNLEKMLNPNTVSDKAIVLSSHFFKSNKRFRFSTIYRYAVKKILEAGNDHEFEQIMDLKRYKTIYQSLN